MARTTRAKGVGPRGGAAKRGAARSKTATRTARSGDPAESLRAALLGLLPARGWRDLSYAEIVEESGLSLAEAYRAYPSKTAILCGLSRALDQAVLESVSEEALDGSTKDRLFDLLMRRFDRLNAHRPAYEVLAREIRQTPVEAICLSGQLRRSLSLMLEAAGGSASGLRGILKVEGLGGVYAMALRTWLKDESADLSATMSELDKRLSQFERCCGIMQRKAS